MTSFVGRRHELATAKRLLSDARLLTLIGPGGVGKTRLALRIASDARRAFPDDVFLVELADLRSPTLLAHTVAAAMGLRDESTAWTLDALADHLASKRMLIILDNCEHLVEACAVFAHGLLTSSPDLRILATSREALRAPGEQILPVPPLSVPDMDGRATSGSLMNYEAVELFVARASARVPGFALSDETREDVARLCHGLEGIPLAIELAADRVRALSLEQINDRLTSRLRLLTGGDRGVPSRQQTLRASLDWSYDLCTESEKILWARLSVFTGGFELDAVEGICAAGLSLADIVDLVSALLEKSLLLREQRGSHVRYRMLETIREYGHDRLLESGGDQDLRHRHRDWYEHLVAKSNAEWIGPQQLEWLSRLRREHANIRAALEFSLTDPCGPEPAMRIGTALANYWIARGLLSEGRHWLDEALEHAEEPSVTRATALRVNAHLATLQGDGTAAARLLDEDRKILSKVPDPTESAYLSFVSAAEALLSNELADAFQFAEEALAAFRTCGDLMGELHALLVLGLAAGLQGETERAMISLQQDLAITESRSESWFRSYVLTFLAVMVWAQGETSRATGLLREALRLKDPLDDQLGLALCYETLAWTAASEDNRERAVTLLGIADSVWQRSGTQLSVFTGMNVFHDTCESDLLSKLSSRAFTSLRRQGADLSAEQAMDYALGKQAQPTAQPRAVEYTPLTRREWEIAQVVTQGLSNRQIANKLVISQRTAEGHVERILVKLGFTSRAQIAAWVAERQTQTAVPPGDPALSR